MPFLPKDCQDLHWSNNTKSGLYKIYPKGTGGFQVYCDMTTSGGGWTVFQRRPNGKIGFNRYWKEYKYGFGVPSDEHWIVIFSPMYFLCYKPRNERIHQLTSQGWYELRVDLSDFQNQRRYAYYRTFSLGNLASNYRLTVGDYEGNAGNSLAYHNGRPFYTRDRQDSSGCQKAYKGGWWYGDCHHANLNGLYLKGHHSSFADGVNWYHWLGYHYSLKTTEMKIRDNR
ncbi:fibrinogen C domain-containing protein 1-like [Saccostrea cucullata]|uniref:fibrinogen C domain-containing protein 1-like n=1 Tax=Saccostrea cuccullata TaxID=36930 RepID=UPI002ED36EA1